ncbi:hypothetical protein NLM33_30545 [Bradyrhizobium sp. CCGUVB1N3]|uniref:hypothetical protein n=1 Tax=Bradyrhizobium sp. CCGUVB1N3 TaxID=2949629 RepID=UPI0020B31E57|nr:hypothetical protein [Bradyrhizobium sp. CCGUVB1N3]MCP3474661.1 hypothetical protein [Bradyrhizobium sp. CCGUVB1N3]
MLLATNLAAIARLVRNRALERAIQYSSDVRRISRSRGVQDSPPAAFAEASAGQDLTPRRSLVEALA